MQNRPAYEIYAEIFSVKQDEYITIGMFIRQKQALFAELPCPHPENVQIHKNSVFSIEQPIDAANCVEHLKNDKRVGINDDTALKELYHF